MDKAVHWNTQSLQDVRELKCHPFTPHVTGSHKENISGAKLCSGSSLDSCVLDKPSVCSSVLGIPHPAGQLSVRGSAVWVGLDPLFSSQYFPSRGRHSVLTHDNHQHYKQKTHLNIWTLQTSLLAVSQEVLASGEAGKGEGRVKPVRKIQHY